MKNADYFINKLEMLPHVEGGFYKEIISSEESITTSDNKEKNFLVVSTFF